jgi:hypothetical protein
MQHWMRSHQTRRRNHRAPPDLRLNPPTVAASPLKGSVIASSTGDESKQLKSMNFKIFEFDAAGCYASSSMQLPSWTGE